jgi:class 3 adenylate cyclase/KaiC/GvpD/RAD55 family RecA-like ATPase
MQIPGLEEHVFPPGTIVLLTARPGTGKSTFAKRFCLEGLNSNERVVAALTDITEDSFRKDIGVESSDLEVLDFLSQKPSGVNEISIKMHELISKTPGRKVRLIFDSMSTLGTMYKPELLPPWLLDQRAKLSKQTTNVLALVIYATGINPPSITRSLHTFSDVVLEMRTDESKEEPERQLRVLKARDVSHSTRWVPFKITKSGIEFLGTQTGLSSEQSLLSVGRPVSELDRVLATAMFVDIVGSTEQAGRVGDRRWQKILSSYYAVLRGELSRFRGQEVSITGDGLLAVFDRPERAVRCGCSVRDAVRSLGLQVRVGIHTGEVQLAGGNISGIAVHIGARVASLAGQGEVLVSSTVKDLVAGAGITFTDRGMRALKGVPEEWHLFSAEIPSS